MNSHYPGPLNIGSSEEVSVNELVDLVEDIAGLKLQRKYLLNAPKGVRGRNSDNSLIKEILDWEPGIALREGLSRTYDWIFRELSIR